MKRRTIFLSGALALIALLAVVAQAAADNNISRIRRATRAFHDTRKAQAAGYDLVPGLDFCFSDGEAGDMGIHYINTELMDTKVQLLKPEAMVYVPKRNGKLQLGAVEYIVPADQWDATGKKNPPRLMGHYFHLNAELGVYVLHAWVWKDNPSGMFEDWNPKVHCP